MATLGQLQMMYAEIAEQEKRYWSDLVQLVDDLRVRIGVALGVNSNHSELMAIGLVRGDGQFVKAAASQLKRDKRELEFAVQVILSQQASLLPPNVLVSQWSIKQTSAGIQLSNKDGGISQFDDIKDVAAHITDVFELNIKSYSPYDTK
ncbi:hypothetical protein D3C77_230440 [compost metagenome]